MVRPLAEEASGAICIFKALNVCDLYLALIEILIYNFNKINSS